MAAIAELARALQFIVLTMKKIARLFTIKTKLEVFLITYALGLGAAERGKDYMVQYPGNVGKMFFVLCTVAVFIAASKMLEAIELHKAFGVD
ncbi:hypothetical protein [Sphingorhabdus contaminans]